MFAAADIAAPAYPPTDLIAKACLGVPLLVFAAGLWTTYLAGDVVEASGVDLVQGGGPTPMSLTYSSVGRFPEQATLAVALASIAVARLSWLALKQQHRQVARLPSGCATRRRSSLGRFGAGLLAVAAAFALLALIDRRPPSVFVLTTAITERDLDRRELRLRYACDEPCTMTVVTFGERKVQGGSPDARLADLGSGRETLMELLPAGLRHDFVSVPRHEQALRPARIAVRLLSAQEVRLLREIRTDDADVGSIIPAHARIQDAAGRSTWSAADFQVGDR